MSFLNVTSSATGRRWIGPDIETNRQAEALTQATGIPAAYCN